MAKMEKKRNQTTVSVSFPEEKMQALKFYLEEKGVSLEYELERLCGRLYEQKVPLTVRRFLDAKQKSETPKEPEITPEQDDDPPENAVVYEPDKGQNSPQNHDWRS